MYRQIAAASFAGGLAHHAVFIRGEWHLRTLAVLLGHIALALAAAFALYCSSAADKQYQRQPAAAAAEEVVAVDLWDIAGQVAVLGAAYLASLFGSMVVYRLYFHQLSRFPGPRWTAASKLWWVWQIRGSRNHALHHELHAKHGSFVRTGPNELSVADPAIYQLLDGWKNDTSKDVWYDILRPQYSAVFSRDENVHRDGRKVWVHSMSGKAMNEYHPRIVNLAESLSRCIRSHGGRAAVDVDDVMSWFSFDVMGDVVFGKDFKLLESRAWAPAIQHRDRALAVVGLINDATWIAHLAFRLVPFYGRIRDWFRLLTFCTDRIEERIERGDDEDKLDMAQYFLKEQRTSGRFQSLRDSVLYLQGTMVTAVVAGSDTTRAGLIGICWFLSKYPEHAGKILAEIQDVDVYSNSALGSLPHLNAFINEALRLAPPVMTGTPRVTGPNGLVVGNTFIPPGTKINTPRYTIMRMESAFPRAEEFIPERWTTRPELIRDRRAFSPFSVGGRQCVGMLVAYSELRAVTAMLVRDFRLSFAPGYDQDAMWRGLRDQITAQPGELLCTFEPREG